jgi:hypothetical protein
MLDLVRKHKVDVLDHGAGSPAEPGAFSVDAFLQPAAIAALRESGYAVEQHEDADELGKARQRQVGQGNRYREPESP